MLWNWCIWLYSVRLHRKTHFQSKISIGNELFWEQNFCKNISNLKPFLSFSCSKIDVYDSIPWDNIGKHIFRAKYRLERDFFEKKIFVKIFSIWSLSSRFHALKLMYMTLFHEITSENTFSEQNIDLKWTFLRTKFL
jgi:hypothetical protein